MTKILEFIGSLMDAISALIDYLFNTVVDLLYLLRSLVTIQGTIGSLFSWLPIGCVAIIGTIFSLSVIFRLIGRD